MSSTTSQIEILSPMQRLHLINSYAKDREHLYPEDRSRLYEIKSDCLIARLRDGAAKALSFVRRRNDKFQLLLDHDRSLTAQAFAEDEDYLKHTPLRQEVETLRKSLVPSALNDAIALLIQIKVQDLIQTAMNTHSFLNVAELETYGIDPSDLAIAFGWQNCYVWEDVDPKSHYFDSQGFSLILVESENIRMHLPYRTVQRAFLDLDLFSLPDDDDLSAYGHPPCIKEREQYTLIDLLDQMNVVIESFPKRLANPMIEEISISRGLSDATV